MIFNELTCSRTMPPKAEDLTGLTFGNLKVLYFDFVKKRKTVGGDYVYWRCLCGCGNETSVTSFGLKGGTKSCGCMVGKFTHGKSKTRIYKIYKAIKTRCYNPNFSGYEYYGGKGIIMCTEWLEDFDKFFDWANLNGYSKELSIDRIDNNGNYEPRNCRWATDETQIQNRSTFKRNTSGVVGVHKTKDNMWCAQWRELGKVKRKHFSINHYGNDIAFKLAKDFRENAIKDLNLRGCSYAII